MEAREVIHGFKGEFKFLSNFYPVLVKYAAMRGNSVEHVYQACKTLDKAWRYRILTAPNAAAAKSLGAALKEKGLLRGDWDDIKLDVMHRLLSNKFTNPALCEKLLATGDAHLEETNWWHDYFWGVCDGVGENHLGKLLMQIREEIRMLGR